MLEKLTLKEYQRFSSLFDKDVYNITVESSIAARNHIGGTAKPQVAKQIARAKKLLKDYYAEESKD